MVADGVSNQQIGARLSVSERTVEGQVRSILNKLGFSSRAQIPGWMASSNQQRIAAEGSALGSAEAGVSQFAARPEKTRKVFALWELGTTTFRTQIRRWLHHFVDLHTPV